MDSQEWEFDFSPNVATNTCDHCKQAHVADVSVTKTVWVGQNREVTFVYCSKQCMHDAHIKALTGRLYE